MKRRQSGQALLIILLVMAVGLTIGLSVVSRSITDIRISQQEEESARAFSVAEAGIEEALGMNLAADGTLTGELNEISYNVSATAQGRGTEFNLGGKFEEGDIQTVWLVEHNDSGQPDPSAGSYGGTKIELYWGNDGEPADQNTTPALEATIIYDDSGFKTFRAPFDPYSTRTPPNEFDGVDPGGSHELIVDGQTFTYAFKATISLPSGTLYALRLRLHYNSVPQALGVKGDTDFPSQGICYESTATVPESGITRKVQQCQFHKAPPGIFDYVLFSGGDLTK